MPSKPKPIHDDGFQCIQHPERRTWCELFADDPWLFEDIEHATASVESGSRIAPCETCLEMAREAQNEE
jgi:hypothetical protein